MYAIRLLRKSEDYCIKGTGYETIIKYVTDNYLNNKLREEEQKKNEVYLKVRYKGITYEYIGKEFIPTLGKEKITLRVGKAIERIPLEKEQYLVFLENSKEQDLEITKIVVFDSKYTQLESLLNEIYIENNEQKCYLTQLISAARFEKSDIIQSQLIYTDKLEEVDYIINQIKYVRSFLFVIYTDDEKKVVEDYIKQSIKGECQLIDLIPADKEPSTVKPQNEKVLKIPNLQIEVEKEENLDSVLNRNRSKTRASHQVTYVQEGYCSYFTEFYKADVFDTTTHTVVEKDAKSLKSGEYLIFLENTTAQGKDIVMYILEDLIKNTSLKNNYQSHYEKFYKWKKALGKYLEEPRHSLKRLVGELKKQKVILSEQAVYQWVLEGRTIAPQTRKSFIALLNILGDIELIQQGETLYTSSIMIRQLHTKVKKILEVVLLNDGDCKNFHSEQVDRIIFKHIKENNRYVKIVQIQSIHKKVEMIPDNHVNRLLNLE